MANDSVLTNSAPASLEEAFCMVQRRSYQEPVVGVEAPLNNFLLNLAKTIKEQQEIRSTESVIEELVEEVIEEELLVPVDVITNLTEALQKARLEMQERKEAELLSEETEKEALLESEEMCEESLPNPLENVFAKLAEALRTPKIKEVASVSSVTDEEFESALNEALDQETEKQYAEQFTESQTSSDPLAGVLSRLVETLQKVKSAPEPLKEIKEIEEEPSNVAEEYVSTKVQNNPYVNELSKATQFTSAKTKGSKKRVDIKKMIAEQISAELTKYKQHLFASHDTGGGGGTNAVQYAAGGTMFGDLNVTGKIFTNGIDVTEAIKNGGGNSGGGSTAVVTMSSYMFKGDNNTTTFDLGSTASDTNAASYIVSMDGAMQVPNKDYVVVYNNTNKLHTLFVPPANSQISVIHIGK